MDQGSSLLKAKINKKMEQSQEILLKSLSSLGISIPENVSSFNELTPTTLISLCCQSLNILGNNDDDDESHFSFPISVEDSVSIADKFKICSDVSLAFKNLGYLGDMNYYKVVFFPYLFFNHYMKYGAEF